MKTRLLLDELDNLAKQQAVLSDCISFSKFERLLEVLCYSQQQDSLRYSLTFNQNKLHDIAIQCRLSGELILQCQRCLQPMTWILDETTSFDLTQIKTSDNQGTIDIISLIEDEVLLAIPFSACHTEVSQCGDASTDPR